MGGFCSRRFPVHEYSPAMVQPGCLASLERVPEPDFPRSHMDREETVEPLSSSLLVACCAHCLPLSWLLLDSCRLVSGGFGVAPSHSLRQAPDSAGALFFLGGIGRRYRHTTLAARAAAPVYTLFQAYLDFASTLCEDKMCHTA